MSESGREYSVQPELLKSVMSHVDINESNYNDLKHVWSPYLELDCSSLAVVYCRHAIEMRKLSGISVKECLTDGSLGWSSFRS